MAMATLGGEAGGPGKAREPRSRSAAQERVDEKPTRLRKASMTAWQGQIVEHPFFKGMKPEHLALVLAGATCASIKAGQILFRQGEPASRFYLLQRGRVLLEARAPADGSAEIQTLDGGEVLGWSWLFAPFVWQFQARALEPGEAIVLDGAHLLVEAERDHEFGFELMKRVAQVVIHRLQATREQLLSTQLESTLKN